MSNFQNELARQLWGGGAKKVEYGSVLASATATPIGPDAERYTSGFSIANCDGTATIWVGESASVTAAVGPGNYPLLPNGVLQLPTANLGKVYIIAAGGATPMLGWVGGILT